MAQYEKLANERTPKNHVAPPESPCPGLSVTHNADAGLQRQTDRNELEGVEIVYERD